MSTEIPSSRACVWWPRPRALLEKCRAAARQTGSSLSIFRVCRAPRRRRRDLRHFRPWSTPTNHARPTASSFGAVNMPLESWIIRSAFRARRPDPYLAAAFRAGRVRRGAGLRVDDDPLHAAERGPWRWSRRPRRIARRRRRCRHPHRVSLLRCATRTRSWYGDSGAGAVQPLGAGPQDRRGDVSSSPRCRPREPISS